MSQVEAEKRVLETLDELVLFVLETNPTLYHKLINALESYSPRLLKKTFAQELLKKLIS